MLQRTEFTAGVLSPTIPEPIPKPVKWLNKLCRNHVNREREHISLQTSELCQEFLSLVETLLEESAPPVGGKLHQAAE